MPMRNGTHRSFVLWFCVWNLRSIEIKVEEFINISKSLGYEICDIVSQYETKLKSAYLFGKGKVEEIKKKAMMLNCETFLVYNSLSTIQKINLENNEKLSKLRRNIEPKPLEELIKIILG